MNKTEILSKLQDARLAHKDWVKKAQLLIDGYDMNIDSIPVNERECNFGIWFYRDCKEMKHCVLVSPQTIATLEVMHTQLHDTYTIIYKMFYATYETSLMSKIFGRKRKIDPEKLKEAQVYLTQLKGYSDTLLEELLVIENKIEVLSDEDLQKLAIS